MKASTLRMLAGIKVVSKPNQFRLLVCNVYAEYDRPGIFT